MTEKRFKLANPNSSFLSMNCGIKYGDRLLNFKEVVDLMNQLNDENEQLKSKNRGLQSELQIFKEDVTHSNFMINKLGDENEQLKSRVQYLERKIQRERASAMKQHEKWEEEIQKENEQLKKENQELRQDNDIKFWKLQCIQSSNNNQIMLFELSRAIQQGYEVSDKFKQYLNEIKEHDKEIREKHKRLFE